MSNNVKAVEVSGVYTDDDGENGNVEVLLSDGETIHVNWQVDEFGDVKVDRLTMAENGIDGEDDDSLSIVQDAADAAREEWLDENEPEDDGVNELEAMYS